MITFLRVKRGCRPPYQGTAKEVQNTFLKNVNPFLECGDFIIFKACNDHILFLFRNPPALEIVARIYNTENGVRAVTNKRLLRNN